jgi:hypothetical protein
MANPSFDKIKPPLPKEEIDAVLKPDDDQESFNSAQDFAALEAEDKHKHELEKLAGLEQDRLQRKEYAGKIFWLVCAWLFVLSLMILLAGCAIIRLSDAVMITLISGASINIIGLMVIVANYLFPRPQCRNCST